MIFRISPRPVPGFTCWLDPSDRRIEVVGSLQSNGLKALCQPGLAVATRE